MKRIIPFLLCIVFCFTCIISVSAQSVGSLNNNSSPYFDLLPYLSVENPITFNGSTERYIGFSSAPVSDYSYIDILFYTDSTDFSIPMYAGGATVYHIDGNLYRAYGQMYLDSHNNMAPYFYIDCNNGSYFTFLSCKVTLQDFSPIAIPYDYKLATPYNSVSGTFSVGSTNVSAPFDTNIPDISSGSLLSFFISLTLDDSIQKKYDYVSIPLSISCNDIASIRVNQGDIPVDFTYNFFNPNLDESTSNRTRYIYILINLSSIDRTSSVPISIYIDGSFASGNSSLTYFHDAYGYISIDSNPIQYWFNSLTSNLSKWFSELINSNESANQNADDFNDSVIEQDKELEEMAGIMDSVSKPEISDINMNVGGMVDSSVVTLTTSGISGILSNEIIIRVLLIAFTFGLIGFILYGKK